MSVFANARSVNRQKVPGPGQKGKSALLSKERSFCKSKTTRWASGSGESADDEQEKCISIDGFLKASNNIGEKRRER